MVSVRSNIFIGDIRVNDLEMWEMVDREKNMLTRLDWGYSW